MINEIRPQILRHDLWPVIKNYLSPQLNPTKGRAHFNFKSSIPKGILEELKNLRLPCESCGKTIKPIRIHHNSLVASLHITGPRNNGHRFCSYGSDIRSKISALMLECRQGENTDRIKRSKSKDPHFYIRKTKDGVELTLDPQDNDF